MRHTTPLLMIMAVLGAGVMASKLTSTSPTSYYTGYQDMLTLVNQERSKKGAKPLCMSKKVMASAYEHTLYQAQITKMTHDGPVGLLQRFTNQHFQPLSVAENVGCMCRFNIGRMMKLWVNSPGHYKAIINPKSTHFGSAVVKGGDGFYYWTQHFASSFDADEPCMGGSGLFGNILSPMASLPWQSSNSQNSTNSPNPQNSTNSSNPPNLPNLASVDSLGSASIVDTLRDYIGRVRTFGTEIANNYLGADVESYGLLAKVTVALACTVFIAYNWKYIWNMIKSTVGKAYNFVKSFVFGSNANNFTTMKELYTAKSIIEVAEGKRIWSSAGTPEIMEAQKDKKKFTERDAKEYLVHYSSSGNQFALLRFVESLSTILDSGLVSTMPFTVRTPLALKLASELVHPAVHWTVLRDFIINSGHSKNIKMMMRIKSRVERFSVIYQAQIVFLLGSIFRGNEKVLELYNNKEDKKVKASNEFIDLYKKMLTAYFVQSMADPKKATIIKSYKTAAQAFLQHKKRQGFKLNTTEVRLIDIFLERSKCLTLKLRPQQKPLCMHINKTFSSLIWDSKEITNPTKLLYNAKSCRALLLLRNVKEATPTALSPLFATAEVSNVAIMAMLFRKFPKQAAGFKPNSDAGKVLHKEAFGSLKGVKYSMCKLKTNVKEIPVLILSENSINTYNGLPIDEKEDFSRAFVYLVTRVHPDEMSPSLVHSCDLSESINTLIRRRCQNFKGKVPALGAPDLTIG